MTIEGRRVRVARLALPRRGATGTVVPVYSPRHRPAGKRPRGPRLSRTSSTAATSATASARRRAGPRRRARCCARSATATSHTYHMNEGHCGLLDAGPAARATRAAASSAAPTDDSTPCARRCVFTTHTPVPPATTTSTRPRRERARSRARPGSLEHACRAPKAALNMTELGAVLLRASPTASRRRHGEVAQAMFPGYADQLDHQRRPRGDLGLARPSRALRPRHPRLAARQPLPAPRRATSRSSESAQAHARRSALFAEVERAHAASSSTRRDDDRLRPPRRHLQARRPLLLRPRPAARDRRAHRPAAVRLRRQGAPARRTRQGADPTRLRAARPAAPTTCRSSTCEDYDMALGQLLSAGVDLWLNNPQKPLEASGTSGMKAALNGVPSLQRARRLVAGGPGRGRHRLGDRPPGRAQPEATTPRTPRRSTSGLDTEILPALAPTRLRWSASCAAPSRINASFFNAQRIVSPGKQGSIKFAGSAPPRKKS